MPFYRRLSARRDPERTRILVLTPESESAAEAYIDQHGVAIDGALAIRSGELKIQSTPTLLRVSRSGEVQRAIDGRIPDREAQAILDGLAAPRGSVNG